MHFMLLRTRRVAPSILTKQSRDARLSISANYIEVDRLCEGPSGSRRRICSIEIDDIRNEAEATRGWGISSCTRRASTMPIHREHLRTDTATDCLSHSLL